MKKKLAMNAYLFNARIFDRGPNVDFENFPKSEPFAKIAETYEEAQRQAVDELWDPEFGILTKHSASEDAADRFNIVFDEEPADVRPVFFAEEIGEWVYDDEDHALQIEAWKRGQGVE